MMWPWKRNRSAKHKEQFERLERDVAKSRDAAAESEQREEKVREIESEALALINTSRTLARENHFGEMIDEALGLSQRKHA